MQTEKACFLSPSSKFWMSYHDGLAWQQVGLEPSLKMLLSDCLCFARTRTHAHSHTQTQTCTPTPAIPTSKTTHVTDDLMPKAVATHNFNASSDQEISFKVRRNLDFQCYISVHVRDCNTHTHTHTRTHTHTHTARRHTLLTGQSKQRLVHGRERCH